MSINSPRFLIGNGYDIHRLTEGRKLIIGGVKLLKDILDKRFSSVSHKQQPLRVYKINISKFICQGQDHTHKE